MLDLATTYHLAQGCQTHSHWGPHQPRGAFKRPSAILGLYKCNYSLARGKELYIWPFEGNPKAGVAPGENEFDTPGVGFLLTHKKETTKLNGSTELHATEL